MKTFKKLAIGAVAVLVAFGTSTGIAHAGSQAFTYYINSSGVSANGIVDIQLDSAYTGDELVVFLVDTDSFVNYGHLGDIEEFSGFSTTNCTGHTLDTYSNTVYNVAAGPHTKVSYVWAQDYGNTSCVQLVVSGGQSYDLSASVVDIHPLNPGTFTQLSTVSRDTTLVNATGQNLSSQTNSRAVNEAFVAEYSVTGTTGATTSGTNWTTGPNAQSQYSPDWNNSQANATTVVAGASSNALTETNGSSSEKNAMTLLTFKCV